MPTNNEDMLAHLAGEQRAVHTTIDSVHEYVQHAGKYTEVSRAALMAAVKAHDAACSICQAWDGRE